jgi:hypothetical protein
MRLQVPFGPSENAVICRARTVEYAVVGAQPQDRASA